MQSVQFQTFQAISIFVQIRLDGSNYHIFPPCFAQMKWKIEGSSAHKHERTLHFLHFSQQYTVHIMARREKNRAGFSHVRVRIRSNEFSPINICLYIIAAAIRTGVTARIRCGYILPRIGVNPAQIGTDGMTRL